MIENVRSYEVSVWTLQDSFITVLKPSNLEHKGQIQNPVMELKDDGDNKLKLQIPMYIRDFSHKEVENPIWYNLRNGTIIANLRKIKVIFNKSTPDEEIFEFVITDVQEQHDGLKKYCEIECEGLAFNELGKQGYKISLDGEDEISLVQKEWAESNDPNKGECPQPNLNYWAERIFKNSNWRYSICMDWSAYDGITHQVYDGLDSDNYENFTSDERDRFNNFRAANDLRRRDKVYEDEYVSAWSKPDGEDKLIPVSVQKEREKFRLINENESNRYNLSQAIAEQFQVFCKYKYYYDDNYHIIDREVIFYNNFLHEKQGIIDFTYKYNTQQLTREMDSADQVSKMFITPLNNADVPSGQSTIADVEANKGLEDYLLNFEYMLGIGTITQEQYDEIEVYQATLHELNKQLIEIENNLIIKEDELIKEQAREKNAEVARESDVEQISTMNSLRDNLTDGSGQINLNNLNPQMLYPISEFDKEVNYVNIRTLGVVPDTIRVYKDYNASTFVLSNELFSFQREYDEYGNLIKLINIPKDGTNVLYATYSYIPALHYDNVIKTYQKRLENDDAVQKDANEKVQELEAIINELKENQKIALDKKNKIISAFERFMGPALREGKWRPEDEYGGYGESQETQMILKNNSNFTNELNSIGWDSELFDDEQKLEFAFGADQQIYHYPCIEITEDMVNYFGVANFLTKLAFVYEEPVVDIEGHPIGQTFKEYLSINSKMILMFARNNNTAIPILTLLSADSAPERFLTKMKSGYLAIVSISDTGVITEEKKYQTINWIIAPDEMTNQTNYVAVYPRIQINSNLVKNPATDLIIKYNNNEVLENYKNYYILTRGTKYYITLKPEAIFRDNNTLFNKTYGIYYSLSNASLAIYLDAIQVLKENAYPKVSYTINLLALDKKFIHNAYARLGQIAHINDYEFKFNNVMGYISEISLNLDAPWEDTVTIKNYKTKFEDLFSTIVAETEQMKKNAYVIGMASDAFDNAGTLSDDLFNNLLDRLNSINVDSIIPSVESVYAQYEPMIRNELRQVFVEAGEVLSAAEKSVNDVAQLNIKNADILNTFKINVKENLTPTNFIDNPANNNYNRYNDDLKQDQETFKVGDIWTRKDGNVYMATENSRQVIYDNNEVKLTSLKGWSLIQDGTLAAIKGASLSLDAKHGKINILAENELNIASGGLLKLAGQDVKIIGNKTVEIGGPDIKIYAADTNSTPDTTKGVHIYATKMGTGTAAVDITGNGIEMRAAKGIKFQSGEGIDFATSDGASTSAIKIDKTNGIYMGSTQPLIFYSGAIGASGSGASAKLSKDEILFGVSNGASGTAVRMTKDYMVLGAGNIVNGSTPTNIGENTTSGAAGVKIQRSGIKMAVGNNTRSYLNISGSEVKIANATQEGDGAIVSISQSGVIIGTANRVTTDSSNNFKKVESSVAKFQVYAPNFIVDANGILYAYGAHISGKVLATSGQIGGWIIGESSLSSGNGIVGLGSTFSGNGSSNVMFWAGNATSTSAPFRVYGNGKLVASNLYIGDDTLDTYTDGRINNNSNVQIGVSRAKVFTGTSNPTPPYKVGDVWTQGSTGDIKYCVTARSSGTYNASDWVLAGKYTDDTTANSKAKITPAATPPSNPKTGDLFISDGTNSSYPHAGRTYRYSGSSWIAISAGVITGTKLNVDTDSGTINMTAKNSINIASGGGLDLAANGVLAISGAGGVTIGSGSNITVSSGGKFIITSDNFSITNEGAVTIKGNITATSGTIGGCSIVDGTLKVGSANITSVNADTITSGTITGRAINNGNGTFSVDENGYLVASNASITGDITANDLYLLNLESTGYASVSSALRNLLLRTDSDTGDEGLVPEGDTGAGLNGMLVTNYKSGSWIKVRKQDGTTAKINFGNARKLAAERDSGRKEGAKAVRATNISLGSEVYSGTHAYNIDITLKDNIYGNPTVGTETLQLGLSSVYDTGKKSVTLSTLELGDQDSGLNWHITGKLSNDKPFDETISLNRVYIDARSGYTKGDFYKTSDTFYVKNGPSSYTAYSGDLYKKR